MTLSSSIETRRVVLSAKRLLDREADLLFLSFHTLFFTFFLLISSFLTKNFSVVAAVSGAVFLVMILLGTLRQDISLNDVGRQLDQLIGKTHLVRTALLLMDKTDPDPHEERILNRCATTLACIPLNKLSKEQHKPFLYITLFLIGGMLLGHLFLLPTISFFKNKTAGLTSKLEAQIGINTTPEKEHTLKTKLAKVDNTIQKQLNSTNKAEVLKEWNNTSKKLKVLLSSSGYKTQNRKLEKKIEQQLLQIEKKLIKGGLSVPEFQKMVQSIKTATTNLTKAGAKGSVPHLQLKEFNLKNYRRHLSPREKQVLQKYFKR